MEDTEAVGIGEDYLRKIIEEMVDNGFKFSTAGTPVCVTASVEDGYYVISVTNEGRGMTSEQIAQVGAYMQFERRIHEQQGAGLGLIICKRLSELHGGGINIESVPGYKTTTTVRLPLKTVDLETR
ncbi:MAG: ATP-binding protein [Anaerolineae bacterium]